MDTVAPVCDRSIQSNYVDKHILRGIAVSIYGGVIKNYEIMWCVLVVQCNLLLCKRSDITFFGDAYPLGNNSFSKGVFLKGGCYTVYEVRT